MYLDFLYLKIDLFADSTVVHVHHVHLTTLLFDELLCLQVLRKEERERVV